jgi:hypothetical protein
VIEFRWNRVAGASHHLLWVTDAAGNVRVQTWYDVGLTSGASATPCSITLAPPMSSGTATWWIQARNVTTGFSAWSAGYQFTVP